MTRHDKAAPPTDAELVAYLDGELSPADSVRLGQQLAADDRLASRAQHLMRGARPFREAFAPLLPDAPVDTLGAFLDAALARPAAPPTRRMRLAASWSAVAAAAVVFVALGVGLDRAVAPRVAALREAAVQADDPEDWRRAVAQYLALYTAGTLAAIPDGVPRARDLADVGGRLGLALTPTGLELPGLRLKRADLYAYDDKPLAFLAYLDPQDGPVALCITPGRGNDAQRLETRRGMNVVYWSQGQYSFMLIGHVAPATLQGFATTLEGRLDTTTGDRG